MSPLETSAVADQARIVWRMRLSSALRTAVACAAVGVAALYGPKFLSSRIKFAAFSYLTAVLIVPDATLGDTVRGCWHAFCATAQVLPLSFLWRRLADPVTVMPTAAAAVAVAVAAFLVAMPECTHLTAKRIAFGQIVLIFSNVVVEDVATDGFMLPFYVAASTALGALASVIALLFPYPDLACRKVPELCQLYAENALERMNIYLGASTATDKCTRTELLSQANPLSEAGGKLLKIIKNLEAGLRWEKPWSRVRPIERLQSMEIELRGIEYSLLSSTTSKPIQPINQDELTSIQEKIQRARNHSLFHSDTKSTDTSNPESPPHEPKLNQDWLFLYFSCINMFFNNITTPTKTDKHTRFTDRILKLISYNRLEFASRCSISLSLAILLGLTFDKENGCWAGLIIAISFVTGKHAIFTIANSRVQGTALGSVYGVVCCFIFHCQELRLFSLLPWIIFTSFLRYSRMYGQTGGVSAAIGALLILGRNNYGPPNEFAMARLAEVFIGLFAFIFVEIFLQPVRTATLARNHVYLTIRAMQDCVKGNETIAEICDLKQEQRNLKYLVSELKDYVADAELEPDFWYLPFQASWYQKLVASLLNIHDMLYFITINYELLSKLSETDNGRKFQERISNILRLFQETGFSHKCGKRESVVVIEEEMEAGKLSRLHVSIPEHMWEAQEGEGEGEDDDEDSKNLKARMFECLSAMAFCINAVVREMTDIEICVREIDEL